MKSPMPSKSFKSLAFLGLTFLFDIYFAIKLSESLMDLVSKAIYSIELCKEIGWKLPLHSSGLVRELGSYSSWMLMTLSLSLLRAAAHGFSSIGILCSLCSSWMGEALLFSLWNLVLFEVSVTFLNQ